MTYTNPNNIKEELIVFLRNSDIISTSDRGVSSHTDTGTFSNDMEYTVSTNPTLIKNVKSIEVGGIVLKFGVDYFVDYQTGKISFNASQTGAYSIVYCEGTSDRIFPDFPQEYTNLSKFPRIGLDLISAQTEEFELGAGSNFTNYDLTIICYDRDTLAVDNLVYKIRKLILQNKKDLFYSPFITLKSMGAMVSSPFGEKKVFQRNQDCKIEFVYED